MERQRRDQPAVAVRIRLGVSEVSRRWLRSRPGPPSGRVERRGPPERGRPRRGPRIVQAARGYDFDCYRRALRAKGVGTQIARRGTPHGSGLRATRYVVEQAIALPRSFRRLRLRWERRADIHEDAELDRLTLPETAHFIAALALTIQHTGAHILAWSRWRRRKNKAARQSHYRRRDQPEP